MPISYSSKLSQSGICGRQRPQQWTKGGSPYLLSPIPLPFSLPPYPLPVSTPATLCNAGSPRPQSYSRFCHTIPYMRDNFTNKKKRLGTKTFPKCRMSGSKNFEQALTVFANISAWIREQERTWRLLNRVQIRPGSQKWQRLVNFLILTRRKTGRFLFQRSRERFCARGFDLRTNFLLFYFTDYLILL